MVEANAPERPYVFVMVRWSAMLESATIPIYRAFFFMCSLVVNTEPAQVARKRIGAHIESACSTGMAPMYCSPNSVGIAMGAAKNIIVVEIRPAVIMPMHPFLKVLSKRSLLWHAQRWIFGVRNF